MSVQRSSSPKDDTLDREWYRAESSEFVLRKVDELREAPEDGRCGLGPGVAWCTVADRCMPALDCNLWVAQGFWSKADDKNDGGVRLDKKLEGRFMDGKALDSLFRACSPSDDTLSPFPDPTHAPDLDGLVCFCFSITKSLGPVCHGAGRGDVWVWSTRGSGSNEGRVSGSPVGSGSLLVSDDVCWRIPGSWSAAPSKCAFVGDPSSTDGLCTLSVLA